MTDDFVLDRINGCDPVITPDGDGVADSYFIKKQGEVKIYNLKRDMVSKLNAPVVWDGTDLNGSLPDAGYYIIISKRTARVLHYSDQITSLVFFQKQAGIFFHIDKLKTVSEFKSVDIVIDVDPV